MKFRNRDRSWDFILTYITVLAVAAVSAGVLLALCGCKSHKQESTDSRAASEVHVAAGNVRVEAASGFGWSRHSSRADEETVTFRADSIVTPQGTIYNPELARDTKAPEAASESASWSQSGQAEAGSLQADTRAEEDVSDVSDSGAVAVVAGWSAWLFLGACAFTVAFAIRMIIKYRKDFHG